MDISAFLVITKAMFCGKARPFKTPPCSVVGLLGGETTDIRPSDSTLLPAPPPPRGWGGKVSTLAEMGCRVRKKSRSLVSDLPSDRRYTPDQVRDSNYRRGASFPEAKITRIRRPRRRLCRRSSAQGLKTSVQKVEWPRF